MSYEEPNQDNIVHHGKRGRPRKVNLKNYGLIGLAVHGAKEYKSDFQQIKKDRLKRQSLQSGKSVSQKVMKGVNRRKNESIQQYIARLRFYANNPNHIKSSTAKIKLQRLGVDKD